MTDPAFFGYGSLVNLATHEYADPRPATLQGWQRVWRHSTLRDVAFLSAEPAAGKKIEGIIARVPGADWIALDQREAAYERHDVSTKVLHSGPPAPTAVYQVSAAHIAGPDKQRPILLSYLDVVVQGYLKVFGEQGAEAFFETTTGWNTPVLDDRSAPRYPRHQTLTRAELAVVDSHLRNLSADIID